MSFSKSILPALMLAALVTPALAHSATENAQRPARMHPADTNKDGVLSRAEFDAQNAARFAEMDKNGDGNVTAEEMRTHFESRREEMNERMKDRHDRTKDKRGEMQKQGDKAQSKRSAPTKE